MNDHDPGTSTQPPGVCSSLPLLPGWGQRLASAKHARPEERPPRPVPLAASAFSQGVTYVNDTSSAQTLRDFALQRPLAYVGFDFEFGYRHPGVLVKKNHTWYDPRSIQPLLLSLALVEPQSGAAPQAYPFVIDVRRPETLPALESVLKLPLPFIAHYTQVELFCLWQLALPIPGCIWDTWTAERAFRLGIHHGRYQRERPADNAEEARAAEDAAKQLEADCKLLTTCQRYNVPHPFTAEKERLQQSFLAHPDGQEFTPEQIDYAAADAAAVARLYPAQVQAAVDNGSLDHLKAVEMPWTITNARMCWDGVRVDRAKCQQILQASQKHIATISSELTALGVNNVNSHPQLLAFFQSADLLDAFKVRGGHSFDDEHLEAVENRHPAVGKIRDLRKMTRLTGDKVLTGDLLGSDGRLHPEHRQLGAESGRNTMSCPNIGGIGKVLRPLVVPAEGFLIGEVDLAQIEVGIAAAVYGDQDLIRMFNGRDVYTAMAKRYYAADLPADAQELPDKIFKKMHRTLRDRMKMFTLATIYNITPYGLALRLNVSTERAAAEQERFMEMFPALMQALQDASDYGAIRGHAYLCSGLRRWRARTGRASPWEVNWMRNTPVQGSAGVVFKVAGNRLYQRYQHYGARLILPMHDAFVFEVPRRHLCEVAQITAEVMRSAVQEYFPTLQPQVEINIDHPHCWNKDGKHASLKRWIASPELARQYLK